MLPVEIANFVGLFVETLLFGILLVTAGHCLTLLLFQTHQLSLKKRREIKWWAVCVTVSMFVISTFDLVLNFRLNLEAFVLILRQESPVDVEQDTQSWVGITRYTLYITQAVIADGILVFRLFVIYGRRCDLKIALLSLLVPITMAGAIFVVVYGVAKHDLLGTDSKFSEIALWAVDVLFNVIVTSLIVYKLRAAHADVSQFALNSDKWLVLIRILIESGLLYVVSEVTLLISSLFGTPSICVVDATGPIIAIASILIISRTHDMIQRLPLLDGLSEIGLNISSIEATTVPAPVRFMASVNESRLTMASGRTLVSHPSTTTSGQSADSALAVLYSQ